MVMAAAATALGGLIDDRNTRQREAAKAEDRRRAAARQTRTPGDSIMGKARRSPEASQESRKRLHEPTSPPEDTTGHAKGPGPSAPTHPPNAF